MKKIYSLILLLFVTFHGWAQRPVVYDEDIHSLRLETKMGVSGLPVLVKGSHDVLKVSFDDLTHEYRRFSYRIEHVGADFITDEGLFDSEYMESDDEALVIENYEQSMSTSVLYTHYSFSLPNIGMRPLLSGNYRLEVNVEDDQGEEKRAFEAYFAVVEQKVSILLSGTTNTEIDYNKSHQQVSVEVIHKDLMLRHPAEELKIIVMQNGRWDNAVEWPKPTALTGNSMKWEHCNDLIFKAGNEYRKFEQMSTRYPGMFVDKVRFFDPYYYASVRVDDARKHYLYDEDQNGKYVYRTDGGRVADTGADYMQVLFQLDVPPMLDADIFVEGLWTGNQFLPKYQLKYNDTSKMYEALILLKQGYYSYQYLVVPHGGTAEGHTANVEGDFFQTENNYTVFVYYRPTGSRYDQLVGWRTASYRPR